MQYRKLLHSNKICLGLTGAAWIATMVFRFMVQHEEIPPSDWLLWIVCNNLMIGGFCYQLGMLTFGDRAATAKKLSWFHRILGAVRKPDSRAKPRV